MITYVLGNEYFVAFVCNVTDVCSSLVGLYFRLSSKVYISTQTKHYIYKTKTHNQYRIHVPM